MELTETQFRLLKSRAKARFAELGRKPMTYRRVAVKQIPSKNVGVDLDCIVPIVAHAVAVFGDEQKATHWLATPLPILGSRSPMHILIHNGDFEVIDQILTRIEHNIPS